MPAVTASHSGLSAGSKDLLIGRTAFVEIVKTARKGYMGEFASATVKESEAQLTAHAARDARSSARTSQPPLAHALGNQAMQRLLRARVLQRKLAVSQSGDAYEQEADRVAEQVMRMPSPGMTATTAVSVQTPGVHVQRMCPECEEELYRKPMEKEIFLGKSVSDQTPKVMLDVQTWTDSMRGSGQALPNSVRAFFEQRFGRDFSHVRLHSDFHAGTIARALRAEAFTVGNDIAFAPGRYAPGSEAGRRLLAHELAHVIQQCHALPNQTGSVRSAHGRPVIMPYRPNDSANFGVCDKGKMMEQPFNLKKDKDNLPWIEKIAVDFSGTTTDTDKDLVPKGDLTATYFPNKAALSELKVSVVGGKASQGLTDKGSHTVTRIEGCGYHHTTVPKAERITGHKRAGKYYKDISKATMNYAVFFVEGPKTGNQAIHQGSLNYGSLACVHISNDDTIRQINYHSVKGHTKVKISYSASSLRDLCCERYNAMEYMVSNPCRGQDPKKCP